MKLFEDEADNAAAFPLFQDRIQELEQEDSMLGTVIVSSQLKRIAVRASIERLKAVRDELFPSGGGRSMSPWEAKD